MTASKIQVTKNYRLFFRDSENRETDMNKHKKLKASMMKYGFLSCFPIVCRRNSKGHLVVKDGQHRLAIAESLALPVHWVEEKVDFDIGEINTTAKVWQLVDHAEKFANNGNREYQEGLDFCKTHNMKIGIGFAMLSGNTGYSNISEVFISGNFKVKDRVWADAVAGIYNPLAAMSPCIGNSRFMEACMAVTRVDYFDAKRLLAGAERVREKLVSYSTRDAYLQMLEDVYNFGRASKNIASLKIDAVKAMHARNACKQKTPKEKAA